MPEGSGYFYLSNLRREIEIGKIDEGHWENEWGGFNASLHARSLAPLAGTRRIGMTQGPLPVSVDVSSRNEALSSAE